MKIYKLLKKTFVPFLTAAMLMLGNLSVYSNNDLHNALGFNTTSNPDGMEAKTQTHPLLKPRAEYMPVWELAVFGDNTGSGRLTYGLYGHDRPYGLTLSSLNRLHEDSKGETTLGDDHRVLASRSVALHLTSSGKSDMIATYFVQKLVSGSNAGNYEFKLVVKSATSKDWNYVSKNSYGVVFSMDKYTLFADGAIDNYLSIAAVDFNGDGLDEIVVSTLKDIIIFKNDGVGFTSANWAQSTLQEGYSFYSSSATSHPSVVFAKGDFDEDGKEDLAWTSSHLALGASPVGQAYTKYILGKDVQCNSSIDKNGIKSLEFSTDDNKFYASALVWADIDGDGRCELVQSGLLTQSCVNCFYKGFAYKKWNSGTGFGENVTLFKDDELLYLPCNTPQECNLYKGFVRTPLYAAVGRLGGFAGTTYVLIGSKIFKKTSDSFELFKDFRSIDYNIFNGGSTNVAVQSGNFYGTDLTDQFVIVAYFHTPDPAYCRRYLFYIKNSAGNNPNPNSTSLTISQIKVAPFSNSDNSALDFCFVNTNNDTPILEYDTNFKAYTDPKVFAVVAAPPFFKDLEHTPDASTSFNNETRIEFSQSNSEGVASSSTITVGAYLSFEQDIAIFGVKLGQVEAEASYKYNMSSEHSTTRETTHTQSFYTTGEDDMVVLYTVPTSVFRYKTYNPKSTGNGYSTSTTDIVVPYEPMLVSVTLDEYQTIYQKYKDKGILPDLSNLFYETGRPDTYPSETPIKKIDGSFLSSATQLPSGTLCNSMSISVTEENSETTSTSHAMEFKAGAGAGGVTVGVLGGFDLGSGYTTTSTKGKTYAAALCGIPLTLKDEYSYGFNWKLAQYYIDNGPKSYSFPFVTYALDAVADNPTLPDSIRGSSAEGKITLKWAANDDTRVSQYKIYRSETKGSDDGFLPTGYTQVAKDISRTTLTWTDTTVTAGKTYYYKMQALKSTGTNQKSVLSKAVEIQVSATPVTSVALNQSSATLYKGQTLQLTATVMPTNATNKNVTWSSSNSNTAIVDQTGKVTPVNTGNVVITATSKSDPDKYGQCIVTVNYIDPPSVTSVTVSPKPVTVVKGKTQQFTANVVAVGGANNAVTWSRTGNNNSGTTISSTGLLTVAIGETATTLTVTATSQFDSNKKDNVTVTLQASSACDLVNIETPSAAIYSSTNKTIDFTVENSVTSQLIKINVSPGATYALYSNEACTSVITSNTMTSLAVGENVAYIKITAQNGTSSTKITVTITRKDDSLPGGTGDINNPYQISTAQQLADFATMVNNGMSCTGKYIVLVNDINLSGYGSGFNGGKGWIPIGDNAKLFKGNFDGQGHTISNLYINDPSVDYNGLFGYVHEGTVKNVGVANANITGRDYFGGVIGFLYAYGSIDNCYVTGTIKGRDSGGGIVGGVRMGSNTVTNCYSSANVSGTANSIGGIAGYSYGKITNCYATGAISANGANAGGIVGDVTSTGIITNCAALNISVKSSTYGGRVAGQNKGTLSGNIAFVGMLNNTNTTVWNNKGNTNTDGVDITALAINLDGTINGLFTNTDIWTTANVKLPGLFGQTVAMPAHLIVPGIHAQSPTITTQPQDADVLTGTALSINVAANVTDGGTLTYQWYENGDIITGATNANYTVPTNVAKTFYYSVVIKNTISNNGDGGIKTISVTSNIAIITVSEPVIITSVIVEPSEAYMEIGKNLQFSAVVEYSGAPAQLVTGGLITWSVTGNGSSGTTISANGLLTVANNETAKTLTVVARSTENTGVSGSATIIITNPEENFSGGTGTEENPYRIATPEDLETLATKTNGGTNYSGKYFILTDNIDLSGYGAGFNGGKGWIAIGNSNSKNFQGIFNGQGHTISNLYINDPTGNVKGLFGYLYAGGTVKNTGLVNVNITGKDNVGAIAGYVDGAAVVIENCYVTGTIKANDSGGGIIGAGQGQGVTIKNCYSTADVSGNAYSIGGIAGYTRGIITNCYATGAITATLGRAGGIVGEITITGKATNCAALNISVKSAGNSGRVAGKNSGMLLDNIAFDEMLNNENTTVWNNKGNVNLDGEDMTKLAVNLDGTINGLFADTDVWTAQNKRLPGLFGQSVIMPEHLRLVEMVVITTLTLPNGTVGTAYSELLEADGSTPITWSIESGNLPDGLSLTDNIISGTPAVAGTFNFTVKAQNSAGSDTKPLSIIIEDETGIDDNIKESHLTVYPNPTKDVLIIKNEELKIENYSILNLAGQILIQGNLSGETTIINVKSLPNGMYFIKVGDSTGKFIKE